jgi:hypothetical protein
VCRGKPAGGPIFGTPGSGKSTFFRAVERVAKEFGVRTLMIRMKECSEETIEVTIPNLEKKIAKKISSILHFTAPNHSLKPSFDLLIASKCEDIRCLINFAEKKFKSDVASWITARLAVLQDFFIRGDDLLIYVCLEEFDELIGRLNIGLLYALRSQIRHLILIDDALAIVLNSLYGKVWPAMMRPYVASFNYWPETPDLLHFSPIVLAPGDNYGGLYRLNSDKYVVMYKRQKWELSPDEVYALAHS